MSPGAHDTATGQFFSCRQIAERYGISLAHVMYLALWRGVGRDIGEGRLVFNSAEVGALRPRESEQHSWRTRSERMLDGGVEESSSQTAR
jgi:hypothetical protein